MPMWRKIMTDEQAKKIVDRCKTDGAIERRLQALRASGRVLIPVAFTRDYLEEYLLDTELRDEERASFFSWCRAHRCGADIDDRLPDLWDEWVEDTSRP